MNTLLVIGNATLTRADGSSKQVSKKHWLPKHAAEVTKLEISPVRNPSWTGCYLTAELTGDRGWVGYFNTVALAEDFVRRRAWLGLVENMSTSGLRSEQQIVAETQNWRCYITYRQGTSRPFHTMTSGKRTMDGEAMAQLATEQGAKAYLVDKMGMDLEWSAWKQ